MNRTQIIEKLLNVKVGDFIIGNCDYNGIKPDKKYLVNSDEDGDKYIVDEDGDELFINYGIDYDNTVLSHIEDGLLKFNETRLPLYFRIDNVTTHHPTYERTIEIVTDNEGYNRILAIATEVKVNKEIDALERQRDGIQRKIDEMKAGNK